MAYKKPYVYKTLPLTYWSALLGIDYDYVCKIREFKKHTYFIEYLANELRRGERQLINVAATI